MNERVSVIIPAYNAEKYLTECVDSVLNQTHVNLDIVIVNDGSIDRTKEILDDYQSKHASIRVVHTENGGVSRARNTGLGIADGEYVMFLDSDDLLAPNAIEILLCDLKDYNADIAAGVVSGDLDKGEASCEGTALSVWRGTDALVQSLEDNPFTYSSCAKLYKREILDNVRFIEGRKIHEDSFFVFSCFLKCPTVTVRDVSIYKYRANESSASHAAFSEKFFDILYFAEKKRKTIEQNYPELLDKAKNMLVKANIAMLQCLLNTTDKKYRRAEKDCIRTVKRYKKYFTPTYPGDEKRFFIIVYNLYGAFKLLYRIKYAKRVKKA